MDANQAGMYFYILNRRKNALHLKHTDLEQFQKYKWEYHNINQYLKDNFHSFVLYIMTDGKNRMQEEYMVLITSGYPFLWKKVKEGLNEGDIDKVMRYLQVLRNVYMLIKKG